MATTQTQSPDRRRRQVSRRRLAITIVVTMTITSAVLAAAAGWVSSRGIAEGSLIVLLSSAAFLVGGLAGGLTAVRDNLPPGRRLDRSLRMFPSRRAASVVGRTRLRSLRH